MIEKCRNCLKKIYPRDEDSGTYKVYFCSKTCEIEAETTMQVEQIVSVTVIIFPDGSTLHYETKKEYKGKPSENQIFIQRCMDIWRKRNGEKYKNSNVCGAIANIRMLKNDFDLFPAKAEYCE